MVYEPAGTVAVEGRPPTVTDVGAATTTFVGDALLRLAAGGKVPVGAADGMVPDAPPSIGVVMLAAAKDECGVPMADDANDPLLPPAPAAPPLVPPLLL